MKRLSQSLEYYGDKIADYGSNLFDASDLGEVSDLPVWIAAPAIPLALPLAITGATLAAIGGLVEMLTTPLESIENKLKWDTRFANL